MACPDESDLIENQLAKAPESGREIVAEKEY
jgi:hypothetical protein